MASQTEVTEPPSWGRVLIAGGTDWPNLGRKGLKPTDERPDLSAPHILRAVSNIRMKRVFSSHSSCHAFFLSVSGDVWVIGRNEKGQCGLPSSTVSIDAPTRLDRSKHFAPSLPAGAQGDIVWAATGRNHSLIVTRAGTLYSAGGNAMGQCGHAIGDVNGFKRVTGGQYEKEKDPLVRASAGLTFSILLTESGKVYALGSTEKGQLGNGRTGEHFISGNKLAFQTFTDPLPVRGVLADKKIVDVQCGQQHSLALDADGYVYVWGFGGYGRLGLGMQADQLSPTLVPQFARDNAVLRAKAIYAGPSCSAILDRQHMYYLAGKWKTSGEGGAGQGYMTYKYFHELMGVHCLNVALGGVTLLVTAYEPDAGMRADCDATMNVVWGQNAANGELGLGPEKPRSATKPIRCEPLDKVSILDIAAGQNTTYYIARNQGETYSELPRFPEVVPSSDHCLKCSREESAQGSEDVLLECEKCENPWHLKCLSPPLSSVPEGEWHCPSCIAEAGNAGDLGAEGATDDKKAVKRDAGEEEDDSLQRGTPSKRARGGKAGRGGKRGK
ncbi:RCC1/BLIP-II [Ceraceosorus guamensis]|uniref:RCC1/BLIP-II n=1 Tax=Ceraceosorus guamensis TaxID=1522189 RepID=A0A316VTX3_9BASI|nr:RCC1/BLIP-II [Ceraceosorus guamensis]PWN41029.1 RCC1/BLIP-II [Ceraceosorus guamensis]